MDTPKLNLENLAGLHPVKRECLALTAKAASDSEKSPTKAEFWKGLTRAARDSNIGPVLNLDELSSADLRDLIQVAAGIRNRLAQTDAERAAFWNDVAAGLDEEVERRVAAERELMALLDGEDGPDDEWTP